MGQMFGVQMCCRPGSGQVPQIDGFNCVCGDPQPGQCIDDFTGQLFAKLGQNCYDLIQEGGGKEQAYSKEICELTPANEKKAQDEGLANVDLKVGGFFACAFSCGTCPKTCEDDPDSLIQNNCEADPSSATAWLTAKVQSISMAAIRC